MRKWKITSAAGVEMGVYEGETADEALDAMARGAGYESQADAVERGVASFKGKVRCVEDRTEHTGRTWFSQRPVVSVYWG